MFDKPAPQQLIAEARRALEAGVRPGFPQKVVANALGIAERELEQGPSLVEDERARLAELLGRDEDLATLNGALCAYLREAPGLTEPSVIGHIVSTTVAKLRVDQPAYPAFRRWLEAP